MLRITPIENPEAGSQQLMLEGRLVGPWVRELQTAVLVAVSGPGPVQLDLSGVHFADAEGLTLLHQLLDQGIVLREVSPFVEELLKLKP
ncbi:MAG: STAS domain-containing protein [Gammaproteobacteria bacterium]